MVRSSSFQGEDPGSTPGRVTIYAQVMELVDIVVSEITTYKVCGFKSRPGHH